MLSLLLVAGTFLFFNPFEVHEAEAATAGRYDWYVEAQCTDSADGWDKQNWTVYGKYNNGTAGETSRATRSQKLDGTTTYRIAEKTGETYYPTKVTFEFSFGGGFTWRSCAVTMRVHVRKAGSGDYVKVAEQSFSGKSSAFKACKGCLLYTSPSPRD